MRYLISILLLVLFGISSSGQDKMVLDSLLNQLKHAGSDQSKARIYLDLSKAYENADLQQAMEYGTKALELATKIEDQKLIADSHIAIGGLSIYIGKYDLALQHYLDALKLYEQLRDSLGIYKSYGNLGVLYDRIEEWDTSLKYYFEALNIYNLTNDKRIKEKLHVIYNNIGAIYSSKGDPESAKKYYYKTLVYAAQNRDIQFQAFAYNNLGKLYLEHNNLDSSYFCLQKSLKLRESVNDKPGIAKSKNFHGAYFIKTGDYSNALKYLNDAYVLGLEVGSVQIQQNASFLLYECYNKMHDYPNALRTYIRSNELNDSLFNESRSREITRIQMQYEFDKKEQELKANEQRNRFIYIITISLLASGIIIVVLLSLVLRIKAKKTLLEKKALEMDLETRNKELTTNVMYQIRKNEMIINIYNRLLRLKSSIKSEDGAAIEKIIMDLRDATDEDVWSEFEYRFEKVHSEFYTRLRAKFPHLSPTDEKLCAFLRLGLSTKEISLLTNLSQKSVDVARTRLRKKLDLTNTDTNLVSYLSDL